MKERGPKKEENNKKNKGRMDEIGLQDCSLNNTTSYLLVKQIVLIHQKVGKIKIKKRTMNI